jgi:hypothetical protein
MIVGRYIAELGGRHIALSSKEPASADASAAAVRPHASSQGWLVMIAMAIMAFLGLMAVVHDFMRKCLGAATP